MQFQTQHRTHEDFHACSGSPVHIQYGGHFDEKGRIVLEEVGKINLYDEIQSHAESCDIHAIMRRFQNGDTDALSQRQGFFGDVLDFPKTYAEALNRMNDMERQFLNLPVEVREKFGNSFSEFLASSGDSDFLDRLGVVKPVDPVVKESVEPVVKESVKEVSE